MTQSKIIYNMEDLLSLKHEDPVPAEALSDEFWIFKLNCSNGSQLIPIKCHESIQKCVGNFRTRANFFDRIYNPAPHLKTQTSPGSKIHHTTSIASEKYINGTQNPKSNIFNDIQTNSLLRCNMNLSSLPIIPASQFFPSDQTIHFDDYINTIDQGFKIDNADNSPDTSNSQSSIFSNYKYYTDDQANSYSTNLSKASKASAKDAKAPFTSPESASRTPGNGTSDHLAVKRKKFQFNYNASSFKPSFIHHLPIPSSALSVPPDGRIIRISPGMPIPDGAIPLIDPYHHFLALNSSMVNSFGRVPRDKTIAENEKTKIDEKHIHNKNYGKKASITIGRYMDMESQQLHSEVFPTFMNPYLTAPIVINYNQNLPPKNPPYNLDPMGNIAKPYNRINIKLKEQIKENFDHLEDYKVTKSSIRADMRFDEAHEVKNVSVEKSDGTSNNSKAPFSRDREHVVDLVDYYEDSSTITSNIQILTSDQKSMFQEFNG